MVNLPNKIHHIRPQKYAVQNASNGPVKLYRFKTAVEKWSKRHQHSPTMAHDAEEQVAHLGAVQMTCDRSVGTVVDLIEFHEVASDVKMVQATVRQQGGDDAQENEEAKDSAVENLK